MSATAVLPSEGNEARQEGRQGVTAPHCTGEAGEPTRGTPWREGGVYAGAGAGLGALFDALVNPRQLIYVAPTSSTGPRLHVAPILTRDRKGLSVAVSF